MPKKSEKSEKAEKTEKASDPKKSKAVEPPKIVCPLSAHELKQFKALLSLRKRQLLGDVSHMGDEALKKGSDSGDLSSLPMHIADQGTDSFEQEMTLGLMENESDEVKEIEEALVRIGEGRFGVCENCLKPVPKARLKAIPYARSCVPCKKKEDGE